MRNIVDLLVLAQVEMSPGVVIKFPVHVVRQDDKFVSRSRLPGWSRPYKTVEAAIEHEAVVVFTQGDWKSTLPEA